MQKDLTNELKSFQGIWAGGYFEGDPLNPLAASGYGDMGFLSVLHATMLRCIKPYVASDTVALEIGPGRGAWTKALLLSKEIYVLDAKSEEENRFFEYLGHPHHVRYFQVQDFKCDMLPENYFTYMFSFGCLCHVSFTGITEYATNLLSKLRSGSNCFWMVADYDKYNEAVRSRKKLSVARAILSSRRRFLPLKWLYEGLEGSGLPLRTSDVDDRPCAGRWYHAGAERTCRVLEELGYRIIDRDVGTCLRDPIIHFTKP